MNVATATVTREQQMLAAWNDYADRATAAREAFDNPRLTLHQKMDVHKAAITAHQRFQTLFLAPTPVDLADESRKLNVEGFALLALVLGFVGLFLPDMINSFWPLAITFVVCAALGGWSVHYLGRLGHHIGRRV